MLKRMQFIRHTWFHILVVGIILFIAAERAFVATNNAKLLPVVIVLGAFLLPVVFTAFFYERIPAKDIPTSTLIIIFLFGGALAVVIAAFLEYDTLRKVSLQNLPAIGLIEESVKLIVPIAIFLRGRYRSEADGLLFGIVSGMGFASIETVGYGFGALVQSSGSVSSLNDTLLIRGLLSPAGHAAWTGLVCAAIWRERECTGHARLSWAIAGTFILAIALHTAWDAFGTISTRLSVNLDWLDIIGLAAVALVSVSLLIVRIWTVISKKCDAELSALG